MLFRTQIFGPRIGGFGITAVRRIFNGVFRLGQNIHDPDAGNQTEPAGAVRACGYNCLGRQAIGGQFAAETATRASNIHKKLLG